MDSVLPPFDPVYASGTVHPSIPPELVDTISMYRRVLSSKGRSYGFLGPSSYPGYDQQTSDHGYAPYYQYPLLPGLPEYSQVDEAKQGSLPIPEKARFFVIKSYVEEDVHKVKTACS